MSLDFSSFAGRGFACNVMFYMLSFCFVSSAFSLSLLLPIHACRMLLFARNIFPKNFAHTFRVTHPRIRTSLTQTFHIYFGHSVRRFVVLFLPSSLPLPACQKGSHKFLCYFVYSLKKFLLFFLVNCCLTAKQRALAFALHSTSSRISMWKVSNAVPLVVCVCVCVKCIEKHSWCVLYCRICNV